MIVSEGFGIRLLISAVLSILLFSCTQGEEITITYIFASHCNSCTEVEKRMETLAESYKKAGGEDKIKTELYNVLIPKYYDPAMELIDSKNVPPSARNLPLLLVGEEMWFYGENDIISALESLESGKLPSTP